MALKERNTDRKNRKTFSDDPVDPLLLQSFHWNAEKLSGVLFTGSFQLYFCKQYTTLQYNTIQYNTIQYNTITLFKEGSAITYYSFLTYGPRKPCSLSWWFRTMSMTSCNESIVHLPRLFDPLHCCSLQMWAQRWIYRARRIQWSIELKPTWVQEVAPPQ